MTTAAPVTHLEQDTRGGMRDYSAQLPCDPQFTGVNNNIPAAYIAGLWNCFAAQKEKELRLEEGSGSVDLLRI